MMISNIYIIDNDKSTPDLQNQLITNKLLRNNNTDFKSNYPSKYAHSRSWFS